ncbi:TadE/TadG family type IV pilus assembly protein [Breoghania corrubedonensis]|nr:TadE/TadG family type IV pilus assembly protein [Breoghania corrubedonensis]
MELNWVHELKTLGRRFLRTERGNVAIVFALSGVVITGVVGGAIDYGIAVGQKSQLQAALDAAVLSGARARGEEVETARRSFSANMSSVPHNGLTSDFSFEESKVVGEATAQVPTSLLRLVNINDLEVRAHAAAAVSSTSVCILLLDESAGDAFKANGSGSIDMPDCEMHVTSRAEPATWIDSRHIDTGKLCIKGTSGGNLRPMPESFVEHCTPIPDPFANVLPEPPRDLGKEMSCVTDMPDPNGSIMVFEPGTYCNWPPINGNVQEVEFEPGDYVIKAPLSLNAHRVRFGKGLYAFKGASVTFNGSVQDVEMGAGFYALSKGARITFNNQNVTGSDVTIYLADKDAAFLTVQGSSKLDVKAPQGGVFKDILLYEAPGLSPSGNRYNLDGKMDVEGLIYLPSRDLHLNGSGNLDGDRLTLVLNKLSLDGKIRIHDGAKSMAAEGTQIYLLN